MPFRWASAGVGLVTLLLFMPGIFQEHNVHKRQTVQTKTKEDSSQGNQNYQGSML
jgi:hypothetical protein